MKILFTAEQKKRAGALLNQAIYRGEIERPDRCEECGLDLGTEGHHNDYRKPLDVEWLCQTCHKARHPWSDERRLVMEAYWAKVKKEPRKKTISRAKLAALFKEDDKKER